jgi:putative ABC transport system ATP-binding protein
VIDMTPANTTAALELRNITITFEGRNVLEKINLQVNQAEKVVLAGPSGCGKSTLLKCILGLVIPQQGAIQVNGKELDRDNVWQLRRQIAYVIQEPEFAPGLVQEALQQPFSYKANTPIQKNLERIPSLFKRFNLSPDLLTKSTTTLSGGEKQRIAIVSALLLDRPIMLLDEVASALDKENRQAVADYFQEAKDKTVLSIAHDTSWFDFADRIVTLPMQSNHEISS